MSGGAVAGAAPDETRDTGAPAVPARRAATIGALVARELGRLGYDRATRHVGVPATVGDLDAEYLGTLLGARVEAVEVVDGTAGTTDRVRLALTGAGVPATVFVKVAAAGAAIRLFGNLADLGGDEVRFYRHVRPGLDLEAPRPLGIDHDPRTRRFVLVLEDLAARGCTFPELVDALDVEQAEAGLDTLAHLHGSYGDGLALAGRRGGAPPGTDLQWLRATSTDPLLPLVAAVLPRLGARLASGRPDLVSASGQQVLARYRSIATAIDAGPHTVLHGDPHPGNWYLDCGRAGLLDWQAIRRGNPLRDVAYFLVLGLDPATRRARERGLLDRYRAALAEHGGPVLTAGYTWRTYRSMAAYPYVAATFTAGFGGLQPDDTAGEGLRRAATAIDDLDPLEALGMG